MRMPVRLFWGPCDGSGSDGTGTCCVPECRIRTEFNITPRIQLSCGEAIW